jgi:hypothetical protein
VTALPDGDVDYGSGRAAILRRKCHEEVVRLRGGGDYARTIVRFV